MPSYSHLCHDGRRIQICDGQNARPSCKPETQPSPIAISHLCNLVYISTSLHTSHLLISILHSTPHPRSSRKSHHLPNFATKHRPPTLYNDQADALPRPSGSHRRLRLRRRRPNCGTCGALPPTSPPEMPLPLHPGTLRYTYSYPDVQSSPVPLQLLGAGLHQALSPRKDLL